MHVLPERFSLGKGKGFGPILQESFSVDKLETLQ